MIGPDAIIKYRELEMCGRFVGFRKLEELLDHFPIDIADVDVVANYNVAPSQEVLAIVKRDGKNRLERFHWGLVPFWAKDIQIGNNLINARSETAATKPSFRNAFKMRRCLIVADGFYEWKGTKGSKQPIYLSLPDEKPFAFAGLWDVWVDKANDNRTYASCTILTKAASASVRAIHHRMPVILKPGIYNKWLDPAYQDIEGLNQIIENSIINELATRPVSKQVNSSRFNDPTNIKPLTQVELNFQKK